MGFRRYSIPLISASSAAVIVTYLWKLWTKKTNKNKAVEQKNEHFGDRKTVPGLLNVGNSCFMGSLLQSLASSQKFMVWLKHSVEVCRNDRKRTYFATTLHKLMRLLTNKYTEPAVTYLDPSFILDDLCGRGWSISMEQQDAHEFLQVVMSTLQEENEHFESQKNERLLSLNDSLLNKKKPPHSHKVDKVPLKGQMITKLTCQKCGKNQPLRCNDFVTISVPIPQVNLLRKFSVENCFDEFFKQEILENVECESCTRLNNNLTKENFEYAGDNLSADVKKPKDEAKMPFNPQNSLQYQKQKLPHEKNTRYQPSSKSFKITSNFLKQEWIGKFPDTLCIHVQRLVWSVGMPIKRSDFVKFPEMLNLSKYAFNGRKNISQSNSIKTQKSFKQIPNTKSLESVLNSVTNPALRIALQRRRQAAGLLGGSSQSAVSSLHDTKSLLLPPKSISYDLSAVIVHLGGWSFSGHFICYRKIIGVDKNKQTFARWLHISDTTVRLASVTEVFSVPAYMLFYQRKS